MLSAYLIESPLNRPLNVLYIFSNCWVLQQYSTHNPLLSLLMKLRTLFIAFALTAMMSPVFSQMEIQVGETTALSAEDQEIAEGVVTAYFQAIMDEDAEALGATLSDEFKSMVPWEEEPGTKKEEMEQWQENFDAWGGMKMDFFMTSFSVTPDADAEPVMMVMVGGEASWNDEKNGLDDLSLVLNNNIMVADGKIVAMWTVYDRMEINERYEAAMEAAMEDSEE